MHKNVSQHIAYIAVVGHDFIMCLCVRTEVIIYVQQRANTGIMSRVTTSDLLTHISSATVKQSLTTQLAVSAAIPRCGMTPEQLKVYMDNPPAGYWIRFFYYPVSE